MKISVLDHGYVEFIEAWGHGKAGENVSDPKLDDEHDYEVGLIEAARQSTQGSFRGWSEDRKLLAYLYKHHHATPFEFAGMVIEVQAPIFVLREWHRHRTQSYNEMSARYSPLPDLYYTPSFDRVMMNGGQNKQASGLKELDLEDANYWLTYELSQLYTRAESTYQRALMNGVPKELARLVMPVGHYSRMRASANLRNWLGFMTLRMDPAAQWEIRQYANAVAEVISEKFPHTWALFNKERGNVPTT